ncbi:MAG: DNA starvation/stationary phase protection protein [Cyclobacteriaceae bacterium]
MNDIAEKNKTLTKERSFNKLGYTKLETAELVDGLNNLLANYAVHYQKLRNFHWNVKGPDFFELHEKFEEQYNDAKVAVDEVAERIRVFGQTPFSTMREFLDNSEIKESSTDLSSFEMVQEILNDYLVLLEYMFKVVEIAIENGDSGSEDMVKSYIKGIEKNHWMFTAFSRKN